MGKQHSHQCLSALLMLCLALACTASLASSTTNNSNRGTLFGIHHQQRHNNLKLDSNNEQVFRLLRGGSTAEATEDDGDEDATKATTTTKEGAEQENDEEEDNAALPSAMSSQPVRLLILTNWGNSVVDHRVELMAARTRTVASLKKSVSRQLPGRPSILDLELVCEGRVLEDEMLVDELFDDDDDDDEEEEDSDGVTKVLFLNTVPPVDPKFATELGPKLRAHVEDDDETLSTEELVDAYFLNQAAMSRNAQLLANPNLPSSPLLRLEIQEQARQLREQLQSQIPTDVWERSLEPVRKSHHAEERRGQRYRSGKGGARTNLKKSIQHNLNIHWGETIRNSLLFLFFGYFGGRDTVSRTLMLWGAPLCFILQTRYYKFRFKVLFYSMVDPPGIVLSLLPAPQQAILSMNMEKSYAALYSTEEEKVAAQQTAFKSKVVEEEEDAEDDEESEAADEEESEDESEAEDVEESEDVSSEDESEDDEE